jgi:hypothetical protein
MKNLMKKTYILPSVKVYTIKLQPILAGSTGDGTGVTSTTYQGSLNNVDSRDDAQNLWEDDEDN